MAKKASKKKKTKKKQMAIKNKTIHKPEIEFSVDDTGLIKDEIETDQNEKGSGHFKSD
ncbi:MAG: hypothetical protein J7K15_12870 [Deltaproteobacteria bacterium]|nr:hypothetical protein [Deltaproteobacteria bacterium]